MKRIFISGKIPKIAYDLLSEKFDVTMHNNLSLLSKDELISGVQHADALLCLLSDTIDKDVINASPNLKIIANYGAGFNNIDLTAAGARGIPVTNTPDVSTEATADLTIGLMLAIARRIVEGDKLVREGKFTGWAPLFHLGVEVTGKTLGIIGMGSIGQAVAKRARAFDMDVVYYQRHRLKPAREEELGARYLSKEEVISQSDFLSLNLSYNPALHHLIGPQEFSMMKKEAYFINAARGPLVDERALLEALKNRTIAGAALDVYEFEPNLTPGLDQLDNIILCPHLGNATVETRDAMAEIAARNILSVLMGGDPLTCVNGEQLRPSLAQAAK